MVDTEKSVGLEKWERNVAMLEDRRAGMTFGELGEKYDVSRQRAHELVKQTERVLEKRADRELHVAMEEAFARENPIITGIGSRGRNALKSVGIVRDHQLEGMGEEDFRKIRGVGDGVIEEIRRMGGDI